MTRLADNLNMQPGSAAAWRAADRHCLWHPYSRFSDMARDDFPVIDHGRGAYLYDADGRRYFDAISSWWACNLGHGNAGIVRAIARQAGKLQHSILGNMTHPGAIELAQALNGLFAGPPRKIMFAADGACSVEAAIKIAVQYRHNTGKPAKRRLVALSGAYHGDTLGAVAAGYQPAFHRPFRNLLFRVTRVKAPFCAACDRHARRNGCGLACFAPMRTLIERQAAEITAVIVEPLCQGAAGMRIHRPGYLRRLAQLCRRHDILLIADEIAMGMGRTGRMFAHQHAGIDPDIVCLGKGLAGGYLPISATAVKDEIHRTFDDRPIDRSFYHGHTFTGNPIACAAALETLRQYEKRHVLERTRTNAALLAGEFERVAGLPGIMRPRTLGMIAACDIAGPAAAAAARARRIRVDLMRRGVLIRPLGRTLYLMPPLLSTAAQLRRLTDLVARAVAGNPPRPRRRRNPASGDCR